MFTKFRVNGQNESESVMITLALYPVSTDTQEPCTVSGLSLKCYAVLYGKHQKAGGSVQALNLHHIWQDTGEFRSC